MANFNLNDGDFREEGRITLSWFHGQATQYHVSWRVYRRLAGEASWDLLHETTSTDPQQEYHDYFAPANVEVEYVLVDTFTDSGGQNLQEGDYQPVRSTVPDDDKYWLLHPSDPSLNVRLRHATGEQFTDEYEEEELLIIGRGRKVDRGESWGSTGTLNVTFKGTDAREQRQAFKALRDQPTYVFLRNPFGDVLKVSLFGGVSYTREAGVGIREFVEAGIGYREVA